MPIEQKLTPDPDLVEQLTDDIAVQGTEGEGPKTTDDPSTKDDDDQAAQMEEVQEQAAHEREEGGYQ